MGDGQLRGRTVNAVTEKEKERKEKEILRE
jgi:hypothetical protein